jgi:glycosyltransferase involved in cell wall biosynthesis
MNLLLINYEFPPIGGGAGNATHFLAKAMVALGHEVTVLTGAWKEHRGTTQHADGFKLIRILVKRQHPSMATPKEMGSFVFNAFRALPRVINEYRISHSLIFFTIPNGPLGWWLKRRYDIPYIVSLRGGDVPKLVPEIETIHRLLTPIRQMALKQSHRIVANARGLANLSQETDPYHVDVIPNGVDTNTFKPSDHTKDDGKFNIVFVGRFHRQKNLLLLIQCFSELLTSEAVALHLHLVGQGPMEEQLFELAETLGLQAHITWHGWTNKKDLIQIYQNSQLMVNPSFYEGLPNAVLEGMASGLPFVVSDIPGNHDLITQECGWTFDIEDGEALKSCLLHAIQNRDLLRSMGRQSRIRVQDHYDWKVVAQQYLELFDGPARGSV